MLRYLVKIQLTVNSLAGKSTYNAGEAIRLSSANAATLTRNGYLVESNIGFDLIYRYERRVCELITHLGYAQHEAETEAKDLIGSLLKRHDSLKSVKPPTQEFLEEVAKFNNNSTGNSPISKIQSDKGTGEWAGYYCNIGKGCSHGCLYCFAEKRASRFKQVESREEWLEEVDREGSTANSKKLDAPIMFPTSHDITATYLPAYRCHLHNILSAGNQVVLVSKPHRESITSICSDFSSFRDALTFRFSIGGTDNEVMRHWEPGAPSFTERMECLQHAFEQGYKTSVSAEPMLGGRADAEKLYYRVEPYVTEDVWFGKMKYIGGMRNDSDPEKASQAITLLDQQTNDEILQLVDRMKGLPKVAWKDSIVEVVEPDKKKYKKSGEEND